MHGSKISLFVATIIGLNAMIGAGILTMPAALSAQAGPAGMLSFVLAALVVLCMSYAFSRLTINRPSQAWSYDYTAQWAGHSAGMIVAACYLIGIIVGMGFLIQQAGIWAQAILPGPDWLLGAVLHVVLIGLVIAGARASTLGQYGIAVIMIASLFVTAGLCLTRFDVQRLIPFAPHGVTPILLATPKAMFAMLGFESVISLFTIVRDPDKNVPRAAVAAVVIVALIYLFFIGSVLVSIPQNLLSGGTHVTLATVMTQFMPEYGFASHLIWLGGFFCIIGTLHSMIWSGNVLFYECLEHAKHGQRLRDGLLQDKRIGVILIGGLMLLVGLTMSSDVVLDLAVAAVAVSYVASIIGLLKVRREWTSGRNIIALFAIAGGMTFFLFAMTHLFFG